MPRNHKITLRTGSSAPNAVDFAVSEPAWDSTNKKLYIKAADNTMAEIGAERVNNNSAPNGTVNVTSISALETSTDVDFALISRGTGATLTSIPDSTATGGNKRGTHATDWQKSRSAATHVASGNQSVIGGGNGNIGSGLLSTIAGGDFNTASSSYSSIGGGGGHAANSLAGTIPGGRRGSTRGVVGYMALPACNQPIAQVSGVSQGGVLVLAVETTNASPTVLRSDTSAAGTSNQLVLPNNSAYLVRGSVVANVTGAGNSRGWTLEVLIKRGASAGTTALVGSVVLNSIAYDAGAAAWVVSVTADTTNGALAVTVTGAAATTIRWVCKLETTEATF